MSLIETVVHEKNDIYGGIKDDVDPPQQISDTTETPSAEMSESSLVTNVTVENDGGAVNILKTTNPTDDIKQKFLESAKEAKEMFNKTKRKRRRRKSKRKSYNKPYAKTNWKFQMPKVIDNKQRRINMFAFGQPIAPYNTNKFLMEDHMVEMQTNRATPTGRTRDSSFSVDSEENYFFSLPEDEEEFLTKEFSSVYEIARSERLENMTKVELIKEFLQLEADYEQLNKLERQRKRADADAKEQQKKSTNETQNKIYALEEKIKELNVENNELKRLLRGTADDTIEMQENQICSNSSEDSESDSSSSSSSSSSGHSNSSHRSSLSCDNEDYSMGFNEEIQPLCNGALSNDEQLNCNELGVLPSPPPVLSTIEQNHHTNSLTKSPPTSQPLVMN